MLLRYTQNQAHDQGGHLFLQVLGRRQESDDHRSDKSSALAVHRDIILGLPQMCVLPEQLLWTHAGSHHVDGGARERGLPARWG